MVDELTKDLALETILEVARNIAPEIPESLLREIYAVQYSHQFDKDRDISFQELQRVLDKYIDSLNSSEAYTK